MLTHLSIRNLAVMAACDLELGGGLTVLTGETGAGKSILVDALGLVLGDRADLDQIRTGAEQADIAATFEPPASSPVHGLLAEQGLEAEGECLIRRVLVREGRSKAFVNGRPVPIQTLRDLGEHLVDIHGQGEHHTLLHGSVQRDLLDAYAGAGDQARWVADAYHAWRKAQGELDELEAAHQERDERRDLLRYQVGELEELALADGEVAELETERSRLGSVNQLLEGSQWLLQALYEADGSVSEQLGAAQSRAEELAETDDALSEPRELINQALAQAEEAADGVRSYLNRLEADPERLATVEERLNRVYDLARKHHVDPEELPGLAERLRAELDELEDMEPRLEAARAEVDRTRGVFWEAAGELSRMRTTAAAKLAERVTEELQVLGMPHAALEVSVEAAAEDSGAAASGIDSVAFLVRTNPGEPAKPLGKVASGGELSRISLGLQVVLAWHTEVPTLVFDEVDVGVSGAVAEMVGRKLRAVGERGQALTVTHLAQVAAQGHHHLHISKEVAEGATYTQLAHLDTEQRVEEIAHILGASTITDTTRANAREMLQAAGEA